MISCQRLEWMIQVLSSETLASTAYDVFATLVHDWTADNNEYTRRLISRLYSSHEQAH